MYYRIVALVLSTLLLTMLPATPSAQAANGWGFTNLLTVGSEGFTGIQAAQIGSDGTVVVHGQRSGRTGLYRLGGSITTVAEEGVALASDLGTPTLIQAFNIDPQGRVVFTARITGGTLPASNAFRAFRWTGGSYALMQPDDGSTHLVGGMSSSGEWLTEKLLSGNNGSGVRSFSRTNGLTSTLLLTADDTSPGICQSVRSLPGVGSLNAAGQALIYRRVVDRAVLVPPPNAACDTSNETQTWRLERVGATTTTLASGGYSLVNGTRNGDELSLANFLISKSGSAAFVKDRYTNTPSFESGSQQLIVRDAAGERVLLDTAGSTVESFALIGFSSTDQVVLSAVTPGVSGSALFAGPDLVNDRVIGPGDQLFGQPFSSYSFVAVNDPPATFGDTRGILIAYTLEDNTQGLALASKGVTRWTNAGGGNWTTASNWSPNEVPGSTSAVLFGLDASYNVNVGARTVGRASVNDGSVGWNNAQLTLTGPLDVGSDADLVVPAGSVTAGEIIIGSLPPTNPLQPPLARLAVSNSGTLLTTGGPLRVGTASDGQLDLSGGAQASSAESLLGPGAAGTANVRNPATRWATGNLALGAGYTGTLLVELGGLVESSSALVGDGSSRPDPLTTSRATVRGTNSRWTIAQNLNIGLQQSGEVLVENGGALSVNELALGIDGPAEAIVGLVVQGSEGSKRATLTVANEASVGFGGRAFVVMQVRDGALATVNGDLVLGELSEAQGIVTIGGRDASNNRATLKVLALNNACIVGRSGRAELFVNPDGVLECTAMLVGAAASGRGIVTVDGSASSPALLDIFSSLQVGQVGAGTLDMRGGTLRTGTGTVIGANGRLTGSGIMEGEVSFANGSEFDPGLASIVPQAGLASGAPAALASPGTLTISGSMNISPSVTLAIDLTGANSYDRVVVTGSAALNGVLSLRFSNGYAPKQGDTFIFVQAGASSGGFTSSTISGLAPGFNYQLTTSGGQTTLTALNDGVATTSREIQLYLPMVRRS